MSASSKANAGAASSGLRAQVSRRGRGGCGAVARLAGRGREDGEGEQGKAHGDVPQGGGVPPAEHRAAQRAGATRARVVSCRRLSRSRASTQTTSTLIGQHRHRDPARMPDQRIQVEGQVDRRGEAAEQRGPRLVAPQAPGFDQVQHRRRRPPPRRRSAPSRGLIALASHAIAPWCGVELEVLDQLVRPSA